MTSLDRVSRGGVEEETGTLAELLGVSAGGPADNVEVAEQHETLRRAVDALPKVCKEVVMLIYFQGLKYREAAEVLALPVGTVKSRLHTAVQKLTESLSHVSLP